MGKSLILAVKIIGDATSAIEAMDKTAGRSDKLGSALQTASKYSVAALAGITGAAIACGKSASDLEQATGAVSSVFGEYAEQMLAYGEKAADAVGLSQAEYGNMASILGSQLKNMGLSTEAAAGSTNELITLGSDLAATFGGTTADAVGALSALLRGERDPIERYGVSIKQADIDAQKAAMGLSDLTGEAAKNADYQATLALLTKQTGDAQGQFARETDSAAGSAQIAAANFENAKAALGEALLPIMSQASSKLAELAKWFQENAAWITPLVGAIGGLAAAILVINGAYKTFAAIQALQTAAQWANNAAWLASPITWIIIAVIAVIALLVVAIVWVVENWDLVKEKAAEVWAAVCAWIEQVVAWIVGQFQAAIALAAGIWQTIKDAAAAVWEAVIGWIRSAIEWVQIRIVSAVMVAAVIWAQIRARAAEAFQAVISWVQNAIGWVRDRLVGAVQGALNWFFNFRDSVVGVFRTVIDWVRNAIDWIGNLASNAVPGWAKDLLGMRGARFMPVTPELATFAIPSYSARMAITPELGTFGAPATEAARFAAPATFAAPSSLPSLKSSPAAAPTYEDKREQHFHFPNYTGDKRDLIEWIKEALENDRENAEGILFG